MNVLGESFPNEIIEQIDVRQKKHGSQIKNDDINKYLHGNSSWVKLVSSVDISNRDIINSPTLKTIPNNMGNQLAKQYVLFNGTRPNKGSQRSGVAESQDNNNVYGVGGLEFGLRPMPGIISAEIKTLTRGSIKSATVNIRAYNRTQFEIIDLLYLRLGFSVLLEWGHSFYFNKNEDLKENNSSLETEFLDNILSYENILEKIQNKRLSSEGNYDALYGTVKNFDWSFEEDGTYNIIISIISLGDVIESLKMNKLLMDTNEIPPVGSGVLRKPFNLTPSLSTALNPSPLISRNDIENLFNSVKKTIIHNNTGNRMSSLRNIISDNKIDFVNQQWQGHAPTYYVRLGSFIEWVSKNQINIVKNGSSLTPIINFDYNTDTNIIFIPHLFISSNPNICIFKKQIASGTPRVVNYLADACEDFIWVEHNNNTYAKLMNFYINTDYIIELINNINIESNKTTIIQFFENLLGAICKATGGSNSLHIIMDETTNTAIIRDETLIPDKDWVLKQIKPNSQQKTAEFEVYGFNKGQVKSTFVRKFSIKTELSPQFSTLIAYSAAATGNIIGEDSSALSKLNRGLVDRTKPTIINPIQSNTSQSLEDKYPNINKKYTEFLENIGSINNSQSPIWDEDKYEKFPEILSSMMEYQQSLRSEESRNQNLNNNPPTPQDSLVSATTGFIPFNLSLTMDGLSGMKVYHKFNIDSRFLPSNYSDSLEFYIKSITNNIQNNEWVTVLESFSTPKITDGDKVKNKKIKPNPSPTLANPKTDNKPSILIDNKTSQKITLQQLTNQLHPNVIPIFTSFFNYVLANFKGYDIIITSVYRSFKNQSQYPPVKPGHSAHNYGYAVDLNLKNRQTGISYVLNSSKSDWISTGFIDIAQQYPLKWGGEFSKYDPVHFSVDLDINSTLASIKAQYPSFDITNESTWNQLEYKKINVK